MFFDYLECDRLNFIRMKIKQKKSSRIYFFFMFMYINYKYFLKNIHTYIYAHHETQ